MIIQCVDMYVMEKLLVFYYWSDGVWLVARQHSALHCFCPSLFRNFPLWKLFINVSHCRRSTRLTSLLHHTYMQLLRNRKNMSIVYGCCQRMSCPSLPGNDIFVNMPASPQKALADAWKSYPTDESTSRNCTLTWLGARFFLWPSHITSSPKWELIN